MKIVISNCRRIFLFLDFDGVLHPNCDRFDNPFSFLPNFCKAMHQADPRGSIEIVISSSWRNNESLEQLRGHFPPDIASRIIDVTPSLAGSDLPTEGLREREILQWLDGVKDNYAWIALDDRAKYFSEDCLNLFLFPTTDPDFDRELEARLPLMDAIERREMTHRKWRIDSVCLNAELMPQLVVRLKGLLSA